jgi:hypothetical protein
MCEHVQLVECRPDFSIVFACTAGNKVSFFSDKARVGGGVSQQDTITYDPDLRHFYYRKAITDKSDVNRIAVVKCVI